MRSHVLRASSNSGGGGGGGPVDNMVFLPSRTGPTWNLITRSGDTDVATLNGTLVGAYGSGLTLETASPPYPGVSYSQALAATDGVSVNEPEVRIDPLPFAIDFELTIEAWIQTTGTLDEFANQLFLGSVIFAPTGQPNGEPNFMFSVEAGGTTGFPFTEVKGVWSAPSILGSYPDNFNQQMGNYVESFNQSWQHAALVINGNSTKVYVNGAEGTINNGFGGNPDYTVAPSQAFWQAFPWEGATMVRILQTPFGQGNPTTNGIVRLQGVRISNFARYTAPFTPPQITA